MIHFQFINSNDEIRIFIFYQNQNQIISDENICDLNEISNLSNQLFSTLSELNKNLHNRIQLFEQLKDTSFKLYQKCIHPIYKNLDNEKLNLKLHFEFDNKLGFIPFEFFYNGSFFLSEKHHITRKVKQTSKKEIERFENQNFCISGNYSNDKKISKSITKEMDEIANLLKKNSLNHTGPHFGPIETKTEVNNLISNSSIFHYSGHFTQNGIESGWDLKDNIYSITDFQKLDKLPSFLFSNTCGVSNQLDQSNFFFNLSKLGIENILYTTGEINSEFGREFAILFYNEFLIGNNISNSILNARKLFIEKHGYSNPCWLQYNLIGTGELILKPKKTIQYDNPIKSIFILLFLITITSITIVNFHSWYKKAYENKIVHIIPKNINKGFKIFDKNGYFVNPKKTVRIYNNDNFTFYADGFDSLKTLFKLKNSELLFKTDEPTQYIFDNNLFNIFTLKNDTLFINLINNGLCTFQIQNLSEDTKLYFGFNSTKNKNRSWKLVNSDSNYIKIHQYFQEDLFLKIEQNNLKKYYIFNKDYPICEIELDINSIINKNSQHWIFIGF